MERKEGEGKRPKRRSFLSASDYIEAMIIFWKNKKLEAEKQIENWKNKINEAHEKEQKGA